MRTARCTAASRQAELFRHHPHRLIFRIAEIGHPDLPRPRERPRVPAPGGVSFPAFAKGSTTRSKRDCIALPKHPGIAGPRQGNTAKAQGCAVPGCFGTGGKRMRSHTDWRFRREVGGANAEHRRTLHSGTGLHARPVRAALPWRMPGIGRRCSTKWR